MNDQFDLKGATIYVVAVPAFELALSFALQGDKLAYVVYPVSTIASIVLTTLGKVAVTLIGIAS